MQFCPCGLNNPYAQCCSLIINGDKIAQTPEQLMRSRYSAFVQKNAAYLIKTHLTEEPAAEQQKALASTFAQTEWLGLKVIEASPYKGNQGLVEFVAFFRDAHNSVGQIHELSRFVCQDEQWFYLDGSHLPPVKLQRNDPCICGSGLKYKKCCGS